jgi:REP element-mobilizing transposase RayT
MTPPRYITKNRIYYVTVRAVNRSFRFVPKGQVRKIIDYCLAQTLGTYRDKGLLSVHDFLFMSNHFHLLLTDKGACIPDFLRDLDSLLSRELNAWRGIRGTNFEKEPGLVRVVSDERIAEHAVYTLANPVKAFLVAKARHWKGTSSLRLEYGQPVPVKKPRLGLWAGKAAHAERRASKRSKRAAYAGRSVLPDVAYLVIDRPPIMSHLSDEQLRAEIRERLTRRENEIALERQKRGIKVLGWSKVVAQFFLAIPGKTEELFQRRPEISASNVWQRVAEAALLKKFREAYYAARERFLAGERDVMFPEGTFYIHRRWNIPVEPLVT